MPGEGHRVHLEVLHDILARRHAPRQPGERRVLRAELLFIQVHHGSVSFREERFAGEAPSRELLDREGAHVYCYCYIYIYIYIYC